MTPEVAPVPVAVFTPPEGDARSGADHVAPQGTFPASDQPTDQVGHPVGDLVTAAVAVQPTPQPVAHTHDHAPAQAREPSPVAPAPVETPPVSEPVLVSNGAGVSSLAATDRVDRSPTETAEAAESAQPAPEPAPVGPPPPVGGPPLVPLLEDGPLLAFHKPAGLLTVGAVPHIPTLERQVKEHLRLQHLKPGNVYLGIPHRLDRPVSGVVVFARNSKCAARLAEMFRERRVRKLYLAVVEGHPPGPTGELVDWLLKDPDAAHVRVVTANTPGAREARLRYRVLARGAGANGPLTGLEIELDTGRMHQIRVQLASRGWPVLGDRQYGAQQRLEPLPEPVPSDPIELANLERDAPIALHACRLMLKHPVRYDDISIDAPLPENWQGLPIPPVSERGEPGTVLAPREGPAGSLRDDD